MTPIVPYAPSDRDWVLGVWKHSQGILGDSNVASRTLHFFQTARSANEHLVVIRKVAFAHYRVRKDGQRVLYEIAVDPSERRKGHGKRLLAHIGTPMLLKTDAFNEESNAFYQALGFILEGVSTSRLGDKTLNHYARYV
jgi:ribosomal protein S18 acetylase RimI-like enzyme